MIGGGVLYVPMKQPKREIPKSDGSFGPAIRDLATPFKERQLLRGFIFAFLRELPSFHFLAIDLAT
jgi:hypothetical protein